MFFSIALLREPKVGAAGKRKVLEDAHRKLSVEGVRVRVGVAGNADFVSGGVVQIALLHFHKGMLELRVMVDHL